jgi:pimeloyl-ACP methyl ester carboxylesterase
MPSFPSFDGLSLHYKDDGAGDAVVLLHGFAGDSDAHFVRTGISGALVDGGYRVVALDATAGSDRASLVALMSTAWADTREHLDDVDVPTHPHRGRARHGSRRSVGPCRPARRRDRAGPR